MRKFKLYWNKDKETQWLNEMANAGWAMKAFFLGCYWFESCEPGKYHYQIDFLSDKQNKKDYTAFMEESGVEIVDRWVFWIFLRKKAAEGEFELYTDLESKRNHYRNVRNFFVMVFLIELLCMAVEINSAVRLNRGIFWMFVLLLFILVVIIGVTAFQYHKVVRELEKE